MTVVLMKLTYYKFNVPSILTFTFDVLFKAPQNSLSYSPLWKSIWLDVTLQVPQHHRLPNLDLIDDLFSDEYESEDSDEEGLSAAFKVNELRHWEHRLLREDEESSWELVDLDAWTESDDNVISSSASDADHVLNLPEDLDPDSESFKKWWILETHKLDRIFINSSSNTQHTNIRIYKITTHSSSLLTLQSNYNRSGSVTSKCGVAPLTSSSLPTQTNRKLTRTAKLNQLLLLYFTILQRPYSFTLGSWRTYTDFLINLTFANNLILNSVPTTKTIVVTTRLIKSFNKKFM